VADTALSDQLHELISALDRRARHPERPGEAAIAVEAATLRAAAVARLAEIDAVTASAAQ
jgi:hypothetical protein